jgi:serine/threonine protein kinase
MSKYPSFEDFAKEPLHGGLPVADLKNLAKQMGINSKLSKAEICVEMADVFGKKPNEPIFDEKECYELPFILSNKTHCAQKPCLAKYNLQQGRKIGQGKFGVVYAACDDESCPAAVKASIEPLDKEVEVYKKASDLGVAPRFIDYEKQCVMKDGAIFELLITERYDFSLGEFLDNELYEPLKDSEIICTFIRERIMSLIDLLYTKQNIIHNDLHENNIMLRCPAWRDVICQGGDKDAVVQQIEKDPESMLDVRFIDLGMVRTPISEEDFLNYRKGIRRKKFMWKLE